MKKHKLLAFLLALVVSVALWLYAVTVVNPNDTTHINGVRVSLVGADALLNNNLILTGGEGQSVDVDISGQRSNLKELNSTSLKAVADVSNINAAGTFEVSWSLDPPASVASGDIKLVKANRNKITVKVSEYKTRQEIPVEVAYSGELGANFLRDEAVLGVETVSVSGPAEEVDKIDRAVITVDITGATASINGEYEYAFYTADDKEITPSAYLTIPTPTVRVSVPILCYKQVALEAKLIAGGGATAEDAVCTFEPSSIIVTGSEELINALDDELKIEIDLAKYTENGNWTTTPPLPTGVTIPAADPKVKFTLQFKNIKTRDFIIDCAEITLLNNGDASSIAQQTVTIKVRGKTEAVNALTNEAVTAAISADMSKYDATTKTVALVFGTLTGVAVIGEYTVMISQGT